MWHCASERLIDLDKCIYRKEWNWGEINRSQSICHWRNCIHVTDAGEYQSYIDWMKTCSGWNQNTFFLDTGQFHDMLSFTHLSITLHYSMTTWLACSKNFSQRWSTFYICVEEWGVMGCRLLHNSMCSSFGMCRSVFLVWLSFTVRQACILIQASMWVESL